MAAYNQSRVKLFRRCQKAYSFRYDYAEKFGSDKVEMVPKHPKTALYRGTWMHALQEAHHRSWAGVDGESWKEVHARFTKEYDGLFDEEKEEIEFEPDDLRRLFRAYLRFWSSHDSDRYTVAVLADGSPAIEFVVRAALPTRITKAHFKGRIDLLVQDHEYGGLWIWDAKWVKTIPIPDERMMSPQAMMYVWALRQLGYDVRGFVYNFGRNKAPVVPPILKRGTLTMKQRLDTDYATYLMAIKELHGDDWREWVAYHYMPKLRQLKDREKIWFDRQRIPVDEDRVERAMDEFLGTVSDIKNRNKFAPPRSYFYNCKFGCDYHDLCVSEFGGLDISPLVKAKFEFTEERYGD